jgi:HSP20 family protein
MADLIGDLFGEEPEAVLSNEAWVPRVDVEETEKGLTIRADLPGVDPKDVKVSVEDGMLVISGEKVMEKEVNEKNLRRRERMVGKFYRALMLPRGADLDRIEASSNRGVMTITIPRKPELEPRRIEVKPEG